MKPLFSYPRSLISMNRDEDFFDMLLDRPSRRLAVYGTLAPDGANASILAGVPGEWTEGSIEGDLGETTNLRTFQWKTPGSEVRVKLFTSSELPNNFPRIDKFEGKSYARILVPVTCVSELVVANVYESV